MAKIAFDSAIPRILPRIDDANRAFWTAGRRGELRILRCDACRRWVHPPVERCPACSGPLADAPVSGRGTIFTFTVNHQAFHPQVPPPYVIAIVELIEQSDLRVPTNIVNCDADSLACGMPVRVRFESHGAHSVPVFEPDPAA